MPEQYESIDRRRFLRRIGGTAAASGAVLALGSTIKSPEVAGATAPTDWYNVVADYGAPNNGTGSAAAAINSAISAAGAAGGGVVYLPPGTYNLETSITLSDMVTLVGAGSSSVLKLKSGVNAPAVIVPADVSPVCIADLRVDGHGGSQTAASSPGIQVLTDDRATPFGGSDSYSLLRDLFIHDTRGPGVQIKSASNPCREMRIRNVVVLRAGKSGDSETNHGFELDMVDSVIVDCTAASCVGMGFLLSRGNNRLIGSKSFYNTEDGFYISGSRNQVTCCQAQDNEGDGFELDTVSDCVVVGCEADSNQWAGVRVRGSTKSVISEFVSVSRSGGRYTQAYGMRVYSTADYCQLSGVCDSNSTNLRLDGNSNGITSVISV